MTDMTLWLLLFFFLFILLTGAPIGAALGLSSAIVIYATMNVPLIVVAQRMFTSIDSFSFMAVPFFMLAGAFMSSGGVTKRLVDFANALVGALAGGLALVVAVAGMFFAALSGSSAATTAAIGVAMIDEMEKRGYPKSFAAAVVAAGGTVGIVIPPSITMVVYGAIASVSIGDMFLGGFLPGALMGLSMCLVSYFIAKKRGYEGVGSLSWKERLTSVGKAIPALLMPVIIIGGILGGIFTATEASAVAVFYALFVGFVITKKLTLRNLPKVVVQSALVTSAALLIVSMASLFANILTVVQVPQTVAAYITEISRDPTVVMTIVAIFVLICGMFIDTLPAVIILVPVLAPLADTVGIDPLHFAMAFVLNITIGMITPPVGAVLFILTAVGQLSFEKLSRAVLPMVLALMVVLAMVMYIPAISLTLPRWFGFAR